jgi:hypothetical protein
VDVSRTNSSDSIDSLPVPESNRGLLQVTTVQGKGEIDGNDMYRLDSHVVAALQAFSHVGASTIPHLELALFASSSSSGGPASIPESHLDEQIYDDGGLGLGIHLGSIYSQPVTSPPLSMSQRAIRMRSISSQSIAIAAQKGKAKEVVSFTNLDTGLRREVTVNRLEERLRI